MDTDQARRLVTLHDNIDRAIGNLRNANAMATDDPRSTELLEEAGDAYAEAFVALTEAQDAIIDASAPPEGGLLDSEVAYPEGYEPGKAAWIVVEGSGAGVIESVEGDEVLLKLTTPGTYEGRDFPEGVLLSVHPSALTLNAPADAAEAGETAKDGAGEGQGDKAA